MRPINDRRQTKRRKNWLTQEPQAHGGEGGGRGGGKFLGREHHGLVNELQELIWGPGGVTVLFLSVSFPLLLIIKRGYV